MLLVHTKDLYPELGMKKAHEGIERRSACALKRGQLCAFHHVFLIEQHIPVRFQDGEGRGRLDLVCVCACVFSLAHILL